MIYATGIKCPYCGHTQDTFDFLRYLYERKKEEINDGITCEKCGKVFIYVLELKTSQIIKIKD